MMLTFLLVLTNPPSSSGNPCARDPKGLGHLTSLDGGGRERERTPEGARSVLRKINRQRTHARRPSSWNKNLITVYLKNPMNFKTLLFLFFLNTTFLFAQDAVDVQKTNPKTYEYGLKGQNFTYVPFETSQRIGYNKSDLRNNKDLVYLPFFKYRNMEKQFGFDFDMVNIKLADPYQKTFYMGNNGLFPSAVPYGNFQRQEYRFNFFYMPLESQIFYFGIGLLKIDRMYQVENYEQASNIRYDKINSYGISIPLRSKIQILEGLELNLGFDPYITYGNRDYVNQRTGTSFSSDGRVGPYFSLTKTNPNNVTEILGFQAEISLSYQVYDTIRLYFGFMRNQSKIRSINFDQTNYTYFGSDNQLYVSSRNPFEKAIDTHHSFYFGVSNTH